MFYQLSLISDITDGISNFFSGLGGTLLDFIIWLLTSAINVLFAPIDFLFSTFFSDLSNNINIAVDNINNFLGNIGNFPFSLFVNILPNLTKTALLIYLSFLIAYYTFSFAYRGIRVVINLVHKVKFW